MAYWLIKSEPDVWSFEQQTRKGAKGEAWTGVRNHTAKAGEPWVVVDFKAVEPLPAPVTLEAVKTEAKLKDMALIKFSRLSVQPVTAEEWKLVCKMGGLKPV